ncbi:MAG TPA: methyltransferase [Anaerolineae bacterium]|nr:methyltransferase [Anaerolineae bacterium]
MIKPLFSISAMALLPSTSLCAQPSATAPESAANKFMHDSDFHELVARFEDPALAQWQKPAEVIASLGPLNGKIVADIGAGTGYFAFPLAKKAAKVIAIDIDHKKQTQQIGANIEMRLTAPDAPGLKPGEADVVLIVDTFHHIENRIEYLKKLKELLAKGGMLMIVDFKKQNPPPGPPVEIRLTHEQVESELKSAGFAVASTDRDLLPYQYIIKAK